MTQEQMTAIIEDYVKDFLPMYKKVARRAFTDGMARMAEIKEKELWEATYGKDSQRNMDSH
jgi:hypothetical protein